MDPGRQHYNSPPRLSIIEKCCALCVNGHYINCKQATDQGGEQPFKEPIREEAALYRPHSRACKATLLCTSPG